MELAGSFENLPTARMSTQRDEDVPFTVFGYDRVGGDARRKIYRRRSWVQAATDAYEEHDMGPGVDNYCFVGAVRGNVDVALTVEDLRDAFGGALPEVAVS